MQRATELASNAYPSKLFTVEPILTNRECVKLIGNIDKRFGEACEAEMSDEERNTLLRLLLREISMLRNNYWIEGARDEPIHARDLAGDLSNKIFEALER